MAARDAKGRGGGGGRGQPTSRQGTAGSGQATGAVSSAQKRGGGQGRSSSGARAAESGSERSSSRSAPAAGDAGSAARAGARSASAGQRGSAGSNTGGRGAVGAGGGSNRASTGGASAASTAAPGAGGTSASSPTASRPTAGDIDRGKGTLGVRADAGDVPTSDTEGTSERQLDLESVRGDRPAGATGQVRGIGAQAPGGARTGTGVAGRGQGARGPAPWLAGAENPLAMMRRMQDDLDRVFRAFGIPRLATLAPARELEELFARSPALTQAAEWSPQVEVLERGDSLVIRADLPGVKRDDVEVSIENDVLTIRGERRQERSETEGGYRRSERSYGTFFRQIPLPDDVEPSQIEASYEDGVLEVRIPSTRDQQRSRRKVEIR